METGVVSMTANSIVVGFQAEDRQVKCKNRTHLGFMPDGCDFLKYGPDYCTGVFDAVRDRVSPLP